MSRTADLEAVVHRRVLADGDADVEAAARRHAESVAPLLPEAELAELVGAVLARARGLGPLAAVLADPDVTDVMVNAGRDVWCERAGELHRLPIVLSDGEALHLVERVVAPLGLRADRTAPIVDARLPDGSRVHAVLPPVAVDGVCLSIRRFAARALPLSAFAPPPVAGLLAELVERRANVLVAGETGSGKTTLLNTLCSLLPPGERVVTIEDAAELRLPGEHVVRLEARPPSAEGLGGATVRDLVRAALRMRPDRLVVGEARGGEAWDLLQALSTGHDGSLATCHAGSTEEALRRLEAMVLQAEVGLPLAAVREQLHGALDAVVLVARRGRRRAAVAVAEVAPPETTDGPRVRPLADETSVVAAFTRRSRR